MYIYSFLDTLILILNYSGRTLLELAPYVVIGVIVGEVLKLTSWTKLIYKGVSRSPLIAVLVASVLGMVSPLCTYGTVPVVLQLLRAGVPLAPLVTFLSVSSMMNPQIFIYTWGSLGPGMALLRIASILIFGLLLGFALYRIPDSWIVNKGALKGDSTREEIINRPKKVFELKKFTGDVFDNLIFVGFYMVIGILLGAVVEVAVPTAWISTLFKGDTFLSLLLTTLMGVPLYACGGGVLPTIEQFIEEGMSRGAALSFLFVGPATRITPLMALATVLKPVFLIVYVAVVIVFALILGIIVR